MLAILNISKYELFWIKNLSLKYQRLILSSCKDIGIRNLSLWQKLNSFDHSENNNVENVWVDSIIKKTSVDSI